MTVFLVVAVVLVAVGVGSLLWPLLRGGAAPEVKQATAVVALFRDKLRELEAERSSGAIDDNQYQQSRRDIERNLLDAVAGAEPAPAGPRRARLSAVLVGLFVMIAPLVLYVVLGTPDALIPGAESGGGDATAAADGANAKAGGKVAAKPLTTAQVQKMIDAMVDALKKQPNDPQGWAMLARAYAYQRQYPEAVRSFTKALELTPKDARLMADLADAMAMNNGRRLDGEPIKLIERALQIDPKDIKALALAGTAAYDHQQYAKAVGYWERAVKAAPNDPEFANSLKASLNEARQLASGKQPAPEDPATASGAAEDNTVADSSAVAGKAGIGGGAVRGRVTLSASLAAKASPGDTVFVFARAAQGPKVPLALLRRQVKDLPIEFSLDDSMAMMPDFTMSKYSPVIIGARISHSGDAIAAPGDMQGFSKTVTVGTKGVTVTIDQVVQ